MGGLAGGGGARARRSLTLHKRFEPNASPLPPSPPTRRLGACSATSRAAAAAGRWRVWTLTKRSGRNGGGGSGGGLNGARRDPTHALAQAVVREAARDYKKATAVTKDLAQREAELESRG